MNFYVGTSGYSYKEWKGSFYPEKIAAKQMLAYYGECFRTVEINNSFYGVPKVSVLEAWAAEVPAHFQFILKAPQRITHIKRLKEVNDTVVELVEAAKTLKKRLGPILFQLPPNFKKDPERLSEFLDQLPAKHRFAFEFRHASWFEEEIFDLLRKHKVALCIAEAEGDLEVPFVSTTNWGYIRLRQPDYSDQDLQSWIKQIQTQTWKDCFVFFKHEDEAKGPQFANRFLEQIEER